MPKPEETSGSKVYDWMQANVYEYDTAADLVKGSADWFGSAGKWALDPQHPIWDWANEITESA